MTARNLDRPTIVAAALKILVEQGLGAVSLRNVAAALGVRAPSLYWHVASKGGLFGHMSEQLFRECLSEVPEAGDWREWLRGLGIVVWRKQRQIRDIRVLMIQAQMDPEVLAEFTSHMIRELTVRGIAPDIAFDAQRSVTTLATGWTMIPNDPRFRDEQPEPSYLRCLDALIRGWEETSR